MPKKKMAKAAGSKLGIAKRAAKRNKMPSADVLKMFKKYGEYKIPKEKLAKKAAAKKTIGKLVGRALPGVGAAIIAHDVIKGVSKSTCGKRGGKWVSGKCVGTKKTKFKPGAKVRDPISKR